MPVEIREAMLQVGMYCGMPAWLEACKIAERGIGETVAVGEYKLEEEAS